MYMSGWRKDYLKLAGKIIIIIIIIIIYSLEVFTSA